MHTNRILLENSYIGINHFRIQPLGIVCNNTIFIALREMEWSDGENASEAAKPPRFNIAYFEVKGYVN